MNSGYKWDYLKNDSTMRGKILFDLVGKYVEGSVLDINCGYAPLFPHVGSVNYVGFDNDSEAIEHLRLKYPDATWVCATDEDFADNIYRYFDTFIFLGVCSGNRPWESQTEHESFIKLLGISPTTVILEHATTVPDNHLKPMQEELDKEGYDMVLKENFNVDYQKNSERTVWVYQL